MQQPKSSLPRTEVFGEFERGLGVRAIDLIPKVHFFFLFLQLYSSTYTYDIFGSDPSHDPRVLSYLNMWAK